MILNKLLSDVKFSLNVLNTISKFNAFILVFVERVVVVS